MSDDDKLGAVRQVLYDAAVGFMVASKSEEDAWAKVVEFSATLLDEFGSNTADYAAKGPGLLLAEFKVVEKQIKKDFSITALPTKWRSAKHTVIRAVMCGEKICDGAADKPIPKTELSKRITAAKKAAMGAAPIDYFNRFAEAINAAIGYYMVMSAADQASAIAHVNRAPWMPGAALVAAASTPAPKPRSRLLRAKPTMGGVSGVPITPSS